MRCVGSTIGLWLGLAAAAGCGRGGLLGAGPTGGPSTTYDPTTTDAPTSQDDGWIPTTTGLPTTTTTTTTGPTSTSTTGPIGPDWGLQAACENGVQDGDETDVDCGGSCPPCPTGKGCNQPGDCLSGACEGGVCACEEDAYAVATDADDAVTGLAVGSDGDLWFAGWTAGIFPQDFTAGAEDFFVGRQAPYSSSSVFQFGTGTPDFAHAAATFDDSPFLFVAGQAEWSLMGEPTLGASEALVFAADPSNGNVFWSDTVSTALADRAVDVAARPGMVVAVGDLHDDVGDQQDPTRSAAFVAVFDDDGTSLWTRLVNSSEPDFARAVALAPGGGIVVAGDTQGQVGADPPGGGAQDIFLARFPDDGPAVWTRQYGTPSWDGAADVAVTDSEAIYLLAVSSGPLFGAPNAGGRDVFVAKLDAAGDLLWARSFGTSSNDYGVALAIHPEGGVVVAGHVVKSLDGQPHAGSWDLVAVRFDGSGNKLWTRQVGTDGEDRATSLVLHPTEGIFIGAVSTGPLGGPAQGGTDGAIVHLCE